MREHIRIQPKRENATAIPSIQNAALQRSSTAPEQTADEVPSIVQEVLSSSGQPLDADTREFMEPRFGHDFSQVRIHTDERAMKSAQAVNALAYTVGNDVVFDRGQYVPGTHKGNYLLAHELTHVVQQGAGPVAGIPIGEGLSISNPSDSLELEANEAASRVLAGFHDEKVAQQTSASTIPVRRYTDHIQVQRFLAGEYGHQGLEQAALTSAGFTSDEVSKVYFGNWLRDLSQLPPGLLPLIKILTLGEFGREVTPQDLGTYVPSEHLDNPEGGGTFEDQLQNDSDKQKAAWDKMSPEQKAAYEDEQNHLGDIQNAAKESGLPEYIEVGKFHAKQELIEAVTLGRTPKGLQSMGNGLHAIEDYFSHSNFVEVALWNLCRESALARQQYNQLVGTKLGNDAALVGGKDQIDPSQPAIITGTYAPGGNTSVSELELFCTEVEHGQLTKAFVIGCLKQAGITAEDILKRVTGAGEQLGSRLGQGAGGVAGGTIGAVGGGIWGGITGAGHGASEGWKQNSGVSAGWHAFTGLFSGAATGAVEGASEGWQSGQATGRAVGGEVGDAIGGGIGFGAGLALDAFTSLSLLTTLIGLNVIFSFFPMISAAMVGCIALVKTGIAEKLAESQTELQTVRAAQEAQKAGLSGKSHAELAKDSPRHQLYPLAMQLAEYVDTDIGKAMITAWEEMAKVQAASDQGTSEQTVSVSQPPLPAITERVTGLVDKYVSHPSRDLWWHDLLISLLKQ